MKLAAAIFAILAVSAFAQPQSPSQSPGPWSEEPPIAQQMPYPRPPSAYPPGPQTQPPQPNDQGGDQGNAPDRGVARISFMNGNVSVRRGDSGDLVAAILNVPLTIGDRLVTADGARAEVQLDSDNLIRLGPSTEVRFSELAYHRYQIEVATGTTSFRMLRDSDAQIEISTPSVAVHPLKQGIYRVTVKPDGSSEITIRGGGNADVSSPQGSQEVHSGQTMLARGDPSAPEFQITGQPAEDDFDRWSASRDKVFQNARSPQYMSRDIDGGEDLDANGRWVNDPAYGSVWVPQVDPGWAPYQCGRWVWVDYYGWTWVGCESWGWAPYHYGRWFRGSFGWAWWPGPVVASYYWHPALVGFFGFGAPGVGVGIGFGFGHIGWVPLAPFERFHPWYGAGYGGFRGPTIVNNVNVVNVYRNARVANGITAINSGEFGRAVVSRANLVRPEGGELARAGVVRGGVPLAPSRESTRFTNREANTQGLPRTNDNTRFFSRMQTPRVNRIPFEQQRESMTRAPQSNGGSAGWQRFNQPSRGTGSAVGGGQGFDRRSVAPEPRSYNSQQRVRISPPIVQNREQNRPAPNRGSGGYRNAAPRGGGSRGGGHGGGRR